MKGTGIVVASGKGGTGKTTVAVSLASCAQVPVQLLDCDVEEPNAHLFLPGEILDRQVVSVSVPSVDHDACNGCGECASACAFNAIAMARDTPLVFEDLCHGCGGCMRVCPRAAIRETPRRVGEVRTVRSGDVSLVYGQLDVGRAIAVPVIRAVKERATNHGLTIVDAPPGTSCPVVATLRDAAFVVLVAEPTPFGLHDLSLIVETVRTLAAPCGIVVNRADGDGADLRRFCKEHAIPLLAEIPEDRRVAEAYSRGHVVAQAIPELAGLFGGLLHDLTQRIGGRA